MFNKHRNRSHKHACGAEQSSFDPSHLSFWLLFLLTLIATHWVSPHLSLLTSSPTQLSLHCMPSSDRSALTCASSQPLVDWIDQRCDSSTPWYNSLLILLELARWFCIIYPSLPYASANHRAFVDRLVSDVAVRWSSLACSQSNLLASLTAASRPQLQWLGDLSQAMRALPPHLQTHPVSSLLDEQTSTTIHGSVVPAQPL